jgi:hypothetical protein
MIRALVLLLLGCGGVFAQAVFPKLQADYFGEMVRAFAVINKVDLKERTLTVRLEKDSRIVTVPIHEDTELHFRDSWGELDDYFEGQHIMLFMYVDDQKRWAYPRAIQDDIHLSARNGWFGKVSKIDKSKQSYTVIRQGVTGEGKPGGFFDKEYFYLKTTKVWKGSTPAGPETLKEGDEVIQQLIERDGSMIAVEIFDRAGAEVVRGLQDARHKKDQERLGLPAYINDFEPLSGALLVSFPWSGQERAAAELTPSTLVVMAPGDRGEPFGGLVSTSTKVDNRQRIQFIVNPRVAVRLSRGLPLKVFLPNTGPAMPTGRLGVPETYLNK